MLRGCFLAESLSCIKWSFDRKLRRDDSSCSQDVTKNAFPVRVLLTPERHGAAVGQTCVWLSSGTIRSASARRFIAGTGGIANHELRHSHHVARGQVRFCLAVEHCVKGGDASSLHGCRAVVSAEETKVSKLTSSKPTTRTSLRT